MRSDPQSETAALCAHLASLKLSYLLDDDWPWITGMKSSILQFLRTSGEQLDAQIAQARRMPMTTVRRQVSQLAASGEVICCKVTRYADGKKIEGVSCRLSGRLPVPNRGPTAGAT
jgi:hypothetical protein